MSDKKYFIELSTGVAVITFFETMPHDLPEEIREKISEAVRNYQADTIDVPDVIPVKNRISIDFLEKSYKKRAFRLTPLDVRKIFALQAEYGSDVISREDAINVIRQEMF